MRARSHGVVASRPEKSRRAYIYVPPLCEYFGGSVVFGMDVGVDFAVDFCVNFFKLRFEYKKIHRNFHGDFHANFHGDFHANFHRDFHEYFPRELNYGCFPEQFLKVFEKCCATPSLLPLLRHLERPLCRADLA